MYPQIALVGLLARRVAIWNAMRPRVEGNVIRLSEVREMGCHTSKTVPSHAVAKSRGWPPQVMQITSAADCLRLHKNHSYSEYHCTATIRPASAAITSFVSA